MTANASAATIWTDWITKSSTQTDEGFTNVFTGVMGDVGVTATVESTAPWSGFSYIENGTASYDNYHSNLDNTYLDTNPFDALWFNASDATVTINFEETVGDIYYVSSQSW